MPGLPMPKENQGTVGNLTVGGEKKLKGRSIRDWQPSSNQKTKKKGLKDEKISVR